MKELMNRNLPVLMILAMATLVAGPSCALAQDAPAPAAPAGEAPAPGADAAHDPARAERLLRARQRWEKLSPEERDGILRRFEKWNRLPKEQREDMRRRFDDIGGREGAAVVRRRMEDLRRDSPDQIQRMRDQAAVIDGLWSRFRDDLPPRMAERWRTLPPETKELVRHKVSRGFMAVGREAVLRRYATEPERASIEGTDPEARRAALAAVKVRVREAVLAPRAAELATLEPKERRVREVRLLEEHFWECAREGMKERLPVLRAAMEKSFTEKADRGPRRGPDWFQREFGVTQEDLGTPSTARTLMIALRMQSPESRRAFLATVRPELARIVKLPVAEREAAMKALLETIR